MRMCLNKNVLIGLGVVAAAVLLLQPAWFGAALPVLLLAACPLSMLLMMRGMGRSNSCDAPDDAGDRRHEDTVRADDAARLRAEIADLRAALREREHLPTRPRS